MRDAGRAAESGSIVGLLSNLLRVGRVTAEEVPKLQSDLIDQFDQTTVNGKQNKTAEEVPKLQSDLIDQFDQTTVNGKQNKTAEEVPKLWSFGAPI